MCPLCGVLELHRPTHIAGELHLRRLLAEYGHPTPRTITDSLEAALTLLRQRT